MTSSSKIDVIKEAIKQVMDEDTSSSSSDDKRLLSKLMSQLEKLEEEPGELTDNRVLRSEVDDKEEKIVKELKKLKRQNLITHCLLSVMIVLTVAWQISEVSIILKLKDGVSHPFKSVGRIFETLIRPRKPIENGNDDSLESSITSNLIESSPVHDLNIPDFPHLDLPKIDFGFNYED